MIVASLVILLPRHFGIGSHFLAAAGVAAAHTTDHHSRMFASCAAADTADNYTYANYQQVTIKHLNLDLAIDFQQKTLTGFADLNLNWLDSTETTVLLDTRDLVIKQVYAKAADGSWQPAPYSLAERDPVLGSKLTVNAGFQAKKHAHSCPVSM